MFRFKDVSNHYRMQLVSMGFDGSQLAVERKYLLKEKLLAHFKSDVKFEKHSDREVGEVIFKSTMSIERAVVVNLGIEASDTLKVFIVIIKWYRHLLIINNDLFIIQGNGSCLHFKERYFGN